MSKKLNYNTDPVKHFVRAKGWLPAFRTIKNFVDREVREKKRTERCKYLTFCAVQAVDVFMLEQSRYIHRDTNTKRLNNVYFCETELESFSAIKQMIGAADNGFYGDFKKIVLQDIEEDLGGGDDPFDEPSSEEDREKLRLKSVKKQLISVFPFDVINLDFYGNFFPHSEDRYSDSCLAFKEVLALQKKPSVEGYNCNRFLMYLTVYTPVRDTQINMQAMNVLKTTLGQNLGYDQFRNAFQAKFGHINTNDIDFYLQFILGFTKQIVFRESYPLGWQPIIKDIFCYERFKPGNGEDYKLASFVIEFKRNPELENNNFQGQIPNAVENDYLTQLEDIINNKPTIVPAEADVPQEIKDQLKQIIDFRNDFLKEIGIFEEAKFT